MGLIQSISNDVTFVRAALRSLKKVNAVYADDKRTFADVIEDFARTKPKNIAIVSDQGTMTYAELDAAANRYARWAKERGVGPDVSVALLMENRAEYLVAWIGIIKAGGVAALINTNLTGGPLVHSLSISGADHLVLGAELAENFSTAADSLDRPMKVWTTGGAVQGTEDLDAVLSDRSAEALPSGYREGLTTDNTALYIYTSGTTGNPKAAKISHVRLLVMMGGFAAAANATEKDRMYVCLPLYHSAGGVCAVGTVLTVGGAVIVKRRFSTREFWDDVVDHKASLFQYIGELCRYMLNTDTHPKERKHKLRAVVGNGLRPEIWSAFQKRFKIPKVIEFYGATEGNVALMNYDGTVGSVGRIPGWAKSKYNVEIVKFDIESEEPIRGADGLCTICAPGEIGEALGKIDSKFLTGRFDGYADKAATDKKILRDAFEKGDAWFRTGDLMKQDEKGYFYFIDRIGDTFRWKGENVATSEVAEAISVFDGIKEANVYGVHVPGADGRAGMASIVSEKEVDIPKLRAHLEKELAAYAQPLFVRIQPEMEITGTFKHRKVELVKEGFDPDAVSDPIYFNDLAAKAFVLLDKALYDKINGGGVRV